MDKSLLEDETSFALPSSYMQGPNSARVNVLLISLLAVSISISAVAASRFFELGSQENQTLVSTPAPNPTLEQAPASQQPPPNSAATGAPSTSGGGASPPSTLGEYPQSGNGGSSYSASSSSNSPAPSSSTADNGHQSTQSGSSPTTNANNYPGATLYMPVYYSSPYLLPISWGIFIGALIWRGKIRAAWCKQGYDYDTFRLVARMKGSPVRVKLLNLLGSSKNRLQLANELQVDWRTIDNHIQSLTRISLIEETVSVGTTKYYHLTEHGRRVLSLLEENKESFESPDSISSNPPSSQENIGS